MNTFLAGRVGGTEADKEAAGDSVENYGAVGVKKHVLGAP